MSRLRKKGSKPDREDRLFDELDATVRKAEASFAEAVEALPKVVRDAIENAVQPYQAHLAQQEKDALVAEHPGWPSSAASLHVFPARLT